MKIEQFVKSKDEDVFINVETGETKNKAQVFGELRGGVLCLMAKGAKSDEVKQRIERMLTIVELVTQDLHKEVDEFLLNLGKPSKEENQRKVQSDKEANEKTKQDAIDSKMRAEEEMAKAKEKADAEATKLKAEQEAEAKKNAEEEAKALEKTKAKDIEDAKANAENNSNTETDNQPGNTNESEGLKSSSN